MKMLKYLCAILLILSCGSAQAREEAMAEFALTAPYKVVISPDWGKLHVRDNAPVKQANGAAVAEFVVPAYAPQLQFKLPGHEILGWSSTPVLLAGTGVLAEKRQALESEQTELADRLSVIKARLALWQATPNNAMSEEVESLQDALQKYMPALLKEQAELEKRLELLKKELDRVSRINNAGQKISVTLADKVQESSLPIEYSYRYEECGWEPEYEFNARTDAPAQIDVRFNARVWQYSAADWKDTEIILATGSMGPAQPAPLPSWVIEAGSTPAQPRVMMKAMAAGAVALNETASAPDSTMAELDADAIYAAWTLKEHTLPQGKSRLHILNTTWRAPLQWIARPSEGNRNVWLFAEYEPTADEVWPAGRAYYDIDGQNVDSGALKVSDGKITLYFGVDPRVTVRTIVDKRRHGKTGLINTEKTWTWAWTYKLYNQHTKPVVVRVERPEPMIVDQSVKATYTNNPQARTREHMFLWEVDVPADGSTDIEHSVTISAPSKLNLHPVAP